jgi:hypothetical protein
MNTIKSKAPAASKTIKKSPTVESFGELYKDINGIEILSSDSFDTLMLKFYKVMTNWGICQGHWDEGGRRTISSPEWCFCAALFKRNIDDKFFLMNLMTQPPKHLLAYGKKPSKRSMALKKSSK